MDFIKITLVDIDGEAAETVSELFNRYGYGGAIIETLPPHFDKATVHTVIPQEDKELLRQIEVMLALIGQALPAGLPQPQLQFIGQNDWTTSWQKHFYTIRVGRHFIIKPSWRKAFPNADDILIEIDPGLAFGSGLHPTTQLCLHIFEDMPLQGKSFFDVGTGSGILSLAALKLGATPVRAVDTDDVALRVAQENFERNGYSRLSVVQTAVGSAINTGGQQWQIVTANILAHILIEIMPHLVAALAPHGYLILSGVIVEQEVEMLTAIAKHNLVIVERRVMEDWLAYVTSASYG